MMGYFLINGDGTCSFAPNQDFNGQVSLSVTVEDDEGATADTSLIIDILPINDPPVSGSLAYSVDEDGVITLTQAQLLAQASDVEGESLTADNLTIDTHGTRG
ncbi:cadherin-like domain-containing protein [Vibrio sp. SS-MA-C1-2]|uniref:cadherin-like domain-containing protein n=1 Tax=Vibrio sp. SS-MA-C1-2 TaxID=2908646 RepID=UPI0021A2E06F|nr:cadherin-like domain-containing protein [Vibrio sp. SS-MA-C1-2]